MNDKPVNYVSNDEFYAEISSYHQSVSEASLLGKPKPRIPTSIGQKILLICERLSYSRNFIVYGFRDEMVSDAVLNCIQRIDNFDPKISTNPFAYFTQLAWFAFVRRIQIEKSEKNVAIEYTVNNYLLELVQMSGDKPMEDDEHCVDICSRALKLISVTEPTEIKDSKFKKKTTIAHQKKLAQRKLETQGIESFFENE
jgi:hypothetical protein